MNPLWDTSPEVILLVDEENRTRDLCRRILVAHGYTVLEADNGMEALIVAASQRGRVDLVLTDLTLPWMSGARLARAFELLWPGVPVAYLARERDSNQPGAGVPVISKALLPVTLERTVAELLQGRERVLPAPLMS